MLLINKPYLGKRSFLSMDGATGPDAVAPVLTSFVATPGADDRWGEMTVDVDEVADVYWIVQPAATATPSAAQIIAGQDGTGGAAVFASSSLAAGPGTVTKRATGLTNATAYEACVAARDAALNVSSVGSSLFSTDTLIFVRAADGTATGIALSTGSAALGTAQPDADGGNNAISWIDNNDAGTGQVRLQINSQTYFNGANRFRLKVKRISTVSATAWMHTHQESMTAGGGVDCDIIAGTVTGGTHVTSSITALTGGWWQIDYVCNLAGADLFGNLVMNISDGDLNVLRNGTNNYHLYDIRVTRAT